MKSIKTLVGVLGLLVAYASSAYAQSFEVLSVEFISESTQYGDIYEASGKTVEYTLSDSLYATAYQNFTHFGFVQSVFKWHVRYTAPDDVPPGSMLVELDATGHGYVSASCTGYPISGSYEARGLLTDPLFSADQYYAPPLIYGGIGGSTGSLTDGSLGTLYAGTGSGWTQTGYRTWEGTIEYTVNSGLQTIAKYQPSSYMGGQSTGIADLKVKLRVAKIDGVSL